jgi:hypothetical protein
MGWWEDIQSPTLVVAIAEDALLIPLDALMLTRDDLRFSEDPLARDLQLVRYYIKNWSLALDLFLMVKSVKEVLRQRGA